MNSDTKCFEPRQADNRERTVRKESSGPHVGRYPGLASLIENSSDSALAELTEIMHKVCNMIDEHPELLRQAPYERMKVVLSALQQL